MKDSKRRQKPPHSNSELAMKRPPKHEILSDVQGSYTGVPEDGSEMPVQDVDDL